MEQVATARTIVFEDRCHLLEWTAVHKQELDAFSCIFSQHFFGQISILADVSIKCQQRLLSLFITPAAQVKILSKLSVLSCCKPGVQVQIACRQRGQHCIAIAHQNKGFGIPLQSMHMPDGYLSTADDLYT